MTGEELRTYLNQLASRLPVDRYVERRFAAARGEGEASVDMDLHFRGILRDREPKLDDILKHGRVLVLAEPGGGKSIIARSAVHQFIRDRTRVPMFAELKEYRGDLGLLLSRSVPREILDIGGSVDGTAISRAYVLDGIDEIPKYHLLQLGADLQRLFEKDPTASVFLTARQAFYAAHRDALPSVTSLFHILDFSDEDIGAYITKSTVDAGGFLEAVSAADASEEIRNPLVLSIMVEKYRDEGALSNRRTENLSFIIDRLIQSRPRVNRHQQRRALRMLGVAFETCSRNELTEDEALRVIKEAMRIPDADARTLLDELHNSILKRTSNGLAFQMRSYGEYLAAETLEDEPVDRVKELAFLDYYTPNESWLNAMSYLVELNSRIRAYFVKNHPVWTISASPAAFSDEEKTSILMSALANSAREKQHLYHHPLINARRLSRFVHAAMQNALVGDLKNQDQTVQGNALILLGLLKNPDALPVALDIVKNKSLGVQIHQCAILALVNLGKPDHVPELLAVLEGNDDLHMNLLDMIGAIIDESQLNTLLPLIFRENAMLSATYYHFREFKSREALVQTLRYFIAHAHELNVIRAEGYIEPIFELLPQFFDAEIAGLCADLLERIEAEHIYPNPHGLITKLFSCMHRADRDGQIARIYFERDLAGRHGQKLPIYR